jgi:hypothetical protein
MDCGSRHRWLRAHSSRVTLVSTIMLISVGAYLHTQHTNTDHQHTLSHGHGWKQQHSLGLKAASREDDDDDIDVPRSLLPPLARGHARANARRKERSMNSGDREEMAVARDKEGGHHWGQPRATVLSKAEQKTVRTKKEKWALVQIYDVRADVEYATSILSTHEVRTIMGLHSASVGRLTGRPPFSLSCCTWCTLWHLWWQHGLATQLSFQLPSPDVIRPPCCCLRRCESSGC